MRLSQDRTIYKESQDIIVYEVSQAAIESVPLITFNDFRKLSDKRGWSIEYLAEQVKGEIDRPKEVLNRILNGAIVNGKRESLSDVVIPYTVLIELYQREMRKEQRKDSPPATKTKKPRLCACGCGVLILGRRKTLR